MIKKLCWFGLDARIKSVLERLSKNGVKSVDQRSPPVNIKFVWKLGKFYIIPALWSKTVSSILQYIA